MQISCIECGRNFEAQRRLAKYCSSLCKSKNRYNRKKKIFIHSCRHCNAIFETSRNFQDFCSSTCREKWYKIKQYNNRRIQDKAVSKKQRQEIYRKNKNKIIDRVKKYYILNRSKILKQKAEYKRINKEKYNIMAKQRYKNPQNKLNQSMSVLIRRSLKDNKKGKKWETIVGYSLNELKTHLEKQFLIGMTWDNYGTIWHVDHKIPRAAYNYTKYEDLDFKRCWDLKNLQPLWAFDNISKHDKILHPFQPSLPF